MVKKMHLLPSMAIATLIVVANIPSSESSRRGKFDISELDPTDAVALALQPTCCPDSPTLYCDFKFHGFEHIVPVFHVEDGQVGDHVLLTFPAKSLNWKGSLGRFSPAVKDRKTNGDIVVSQTSRNGTFLQCPEPIPDDINTEGQFYVATAGETESKLMARTFSTEIGAGSRDPKFYYDKCVLLPFASLDILTESGLYKLMEGDGNLEYPEKRRCVVFKTTA